MKKKLVSLALALVMLMSLTPAAFAAGFADVRDAETARCVEVLRLMGVVSGNEYGFYRPTSDLTRAEFCKMAIELLGKGEETLAYRTRTIFPDVRASHWAVGYINYAANYTIASGGDEKVSARLIHGLPDGSFAPDRAISFGEAVAIVMRLLGYTDEMTGGIWPQGYIDLAASKGIARGYELSGSSPISRGQAAKLFVDILNAKKADGSDFYGSKSELTTLLWINAGTGTMRTSDATYTMVHPTSSTALTGMRGYVLLDGNKNALTFLPVTGVNVGVANAALIVRSNGSTDGFSALTGGAQDCIIYRNGVEIPPSQIRKNDVATYSAAGNSIQLCDTRVTVKYENCTPSPQRPATITVLGGTVFQVLPTAQESLSKFKPGDRMTLLLTADGEVAGAIKPSNQRGEESNAVCIVGSDGSVQLLCGTMLIQLAEGAKAENLLCRAATIDQTETGRLKFTEAHREAYYGELDTVTRMLDTTKLSSSVMIFDQGKPVTLTMIANGLTSTQRVYYAHSNSVGEYDLIVLGVPRMHQDEVYRGRVAASEMVEEIIEFDGELEEGEEPPEPIIIVYWMIQIETGNGKLSPEARSYTGVNVGSFIEAALHTNEDGSTVYTDLRGLKRVEVSVSDFIGTGTVRLGDRLFDIAEDTPCYNADTKLWMDDLEAALMYAGKVNLYMIDDVVRLIEVIG